MNFRLARKFYRRPTLTVAPELLGKYLVFQSPQGKFVGEINEVEAYLGLDDLASHAAVGRTPRNEMMFGDGGFTYVYFIYGMYFCLNIVTETEDQPGAVLIRSVIPVEGVEVMKKNRRLGGKKVVELTLTNGPGKLCQAFGITRAQNGLDLVTSKVIWIEDLGKKIEQISSSPRVGIRQAIDYPWRFYY